LAIESIYGWRDPITDPDIRVVYYSDIARLTKSVRNRCGASVLVFGHKFHKKSGFYTFGLFDNLAGGETKEAN
jgi:hypothetical protein